MPSTNSHETRHEIARRRRLIDVAAEVFVKIPGRNIVLDSMATSKSKTRRGFPKNILTAIRDEKILGIRAGTKPHRVIGIWAVVVEGRVFVRSWSMKPRSWYRTFLEEPRGIIVVNGRKISVRAIQTRSERLKDAVTRAYAEKYNTPGSLYFVRGFAHKKRKDTTTELVPLKKSVP